MRRSDLLDFGDAESLCQDTYFTSYRDHIILRVLMADLLVKGTYFIRGNGEKHIARGLLWQRTIRHFHSGDNMLRCGYYPESLIIYRSVFETLGLIEFFDQFPEEVSKWFGGTEFRPGTVRKRLGGTAERADIYEFLSKFSHPNLEAMLTSSGGVSENGAPTHTAAWPIYLSESSENLTFIADVLLMGALKLLGGSVVAEENTESQEWWSEFRRASSRWDDLYEERWGG